MSEEMKPPTLFWVIAGLALLWNLFGALAVFGALTMDEASAVKAVGQELADIYETRPIWATAATAMAVIAGVLGSLGLLLRKRWALPVLVISLVSVIIQDIWGLMSNALQLSAGSAKILTLVVLIVAIFLVWFAKKKIAKGYLV